MVINRFLVVLSLVNLLTISILWSCSEKSSFVGFSRYEDLCGRDLGIESNSVLYPYKNLILFDSLCVIADAKDDYWIKVINLSTGQLYMKLGKKGRGPGEMIFVYGIGRVAGNDSLFYVNDAPNRALKIYNIRDLIKGIAAPAQEIRTSDHEMIRNIIPLKDSYFLSENNDVNNWFFSLRTDDGQIISSGLEVPAELRESLKSLNPGSRSAAFSPFTSFSCKGDKFCTYLTNSDFLEFNMIHNDSIKLLFKSYSYLPEIRVDSPFRYVYLNQRAGIQYVSCTDRFVYVLIDPEALPERAPEKILSGGTILVYSWDGTPIKILDLDQSIGLFAVDKDNSYILAINDIQDEYRFIRYDLEK